MSVVPEVAHWAISWRLISFAPAERGGVGGGLGVGAQHRGLADLEHQHADREQRRAGRPAGPAGSVRRSPRRIAAPNRSPAARPRHGPGVPTLARDRGSTFVWDSLGPRFASYLGRMNPRQRRGILLLTLVRPRAARRVRAGGGVRGRRPRGGGPEGRACWPSPSPPRRTRRSRTTWSRRSSCRERWAPQTALRDRARLIGQVAAADIPAGSDPPGGHARPAARAGHRRARDRDPRRRRDRRRRQDRPRRDRGHRRHLRRQRPGRASKPESDVVVPGARIIDVGQPELKGGNGVQEQAADPAAGRPGHVRAEPEARR